MAAPKWLQMKLAVQSNPMFKAATQLRRQHRARIRAEMTAVVPEYEPELIRRQIAGAVPKQYDRALARKVRGQTLLMTTLG